MNMGNIIKKWLVALFVLLLTFAPACGNEEKPGGEVSVQIPPRKGSAIIPPFTTGINVHNGHIFAKHEELEDKWRGRGLIAYRPADGKVLRNIRQSGDNSFTVISVRSDNQRNKIWAGTRFDGVLEISLKEGITGHYTAQSTGVTGRAVDISKKEMKFEPDVPVSDEKIKWIEDRVQSGLYIRLNTEVFQIKDIDWPNIKVRTRKGSHDLLHAGRVGPYDSAIILTGLPSDSVNDIAIDGDTVWLAAGKMGDKGMAGGIAWMRDGNWQSRQPNSMYNRWGRFHWIRSNAALAVERQGRRTWSGWAEIRGLKPFGGVSGNLLNFIGDGSKKDHWRDFTRQIGVFAEGYAPVLHTSVTSIAPAGIKRGDTVEECVVAGTMSMNNPMGGMGHPGRHAWGGGGLRMICGWKLAGLVYKEYEDGLPVTGAPPSNAVYAVDVLETDDEVYAIAGTDAGLYVVELSSRYRDYFYERPDAPGLLVKVGAENLMGENRKGETVHGFEVGSEGWPSCLPDLIVSDVKVEHGGSPGILKILAATYCGIAEYEGKITEESISDCSKWTWHVPISDGNTISFIETSPLEKGKLQETDVIPVSSIDALDTGKGPVYVMGTGLKHIVPGTVPGLMEERERALEKYPQDSITHVRLLYSTIYENPQESLIFADASSINLYTERFHKRVCTIQDPRCLAGDTTLNWKRLDEMTDALVEKGLVPTFCISTFPYLVYRDAVKEGDTCSPPDPENPSCSPSRSGWDLRGWENMMFALTDHFYHRYGREKVSEWTIEVWNEPAVEWLWPWQESFAEDYRIIYESTARAVHACDTYWSGPGEKKEAPGIRLAAPAWHGDPVPVDERFDRVLTSINNSVSLPDLITMHIYPITSMNMGPFYGAAINRLAEHNIERPMAVTEYAPVMALSHDGIGTHALGEVPALFEAESLSSMLSMKRPPEMLYALDFQSSSFGTDSNWPGLTNSVGEGMYAPRPLYNFRILASQAGGIVLPVKTEGDAGAFAMHDPYSEKTMVFVWRSSISEPHLETVNYQERSTATVGLQLNIPGEGRFRTREFKIDGSNNNFLTALWEAGSPPSPGDDLTSRIMNGSELSALTEGEKYFAESVQGGKVSAKVGVEDNSIYVLEIAPSAVIHENDDKISGLKIEAVGQDIVIDWQTESGAFRKVFDRSVPGWGDAGPLADTFKAAAGCENTVMFNGKEVSIGQDELSKALPVNVKEGGLSCMPDKRGTLHVLFAGEDGKVRYVKATPLMPDDGDLKWVFTGNRTISNYPGHETTRPSLPSIAIDEENGVHMVFADTYEEDGGLKSAVRYLHLWR